MYGSWFLRRLGSAAIGASVAVLGVVGLAPSSGAATATRSTVTFAEAPGEPPNYIFPYFSSAYYTEANTQFQRLMFRPLYYFGSPGTLNLNRNLSLAKTPVFSDGDKRVRLTLKPYKWSDGEELDTVDIMFWLNMSKMAPTAYAAWVPGGLSIPTTITSVKATSSTTLTITLDQPLNPRWFLSTQLSSIVPMPLAWTKTSMSAGAGSGGCAKAPFGTDPRACKAVYDFLSEQAGFNPTKPKTTIDALPRYATNPLWKVVDGPWELTSFGPTAPAVFKPNPSYSGPNKPRIEKYIQEPFTSGSSEFNALATGTIDYGYLPVTEIVAPARRAGRAGEPVVPGRNNPRLRTYVATPDYLFAYAFIQPNFNSTGDTGNAGSIFKQLYIRQAFQRLVDQTLYVNRVYKGYAYPTYGPVPSLPKNSYTSKTELRNPYPYDPSAARNLLSSHGWKIVPDGTSTCQNPGTGPGHCGKGIKKGAKLAFTLRYASGDKAIESMMDAESAEWSQAGIHITLSSSSYDTIEGEAIRCTGSSCTWELDSWTIGWAWLYGAPDYYPTGEESFASGAVSNLGSFKTATADELIRDSLTTDVGLEKYENYIEKVLPVIWQPTAVTLDEIRKGLEGVTPLNPVGTFTPATFYWE